MKTYKIDSQKDLDKFKDEFGYKIDGHAEFSYSADFQGRLLVVGSIDVKAGEYIEAGGFIKAGEYIEVGWYIEVGGFIKAGEYIKAGGFIEAGEYIEAGENHGIVAGLSITCKDTLSFGLKCFAGVCTWRNIADEEKTITCGKLEGGTIEYGILKETGIDKIECIIDGKKLMLSKESVKELKKLN